MIVHIRPLFTIQSHTHTISMYILQMLNTMQNYAGLPYGRKHWWDKTLANSAI